MEASRTRALEFEIRFSSSCPRSLASKKYISLPFMRQAEISVHLALAAGIQTRWSLSWGSDWGHIQSVIGVRIIACLDGIPSHIQAVARICDMRSCPPSTFFFFSFSVIPLVALHSDEFDNIHIPLVKDDCLSVIGWINPDFNRFDTHPLKRSTITYSSSSSPLLFVSSAVFFRSFHSFVVALVNPIVSCFVLCEQANERTYFVSLISVFFPFWLSTEWVSEWLVWVYIADIIIPTRTAFAYIYREKKNHRKPFIWSAVRSPSSSCSWFCVRPTDSTQSKFPYIWWTWARVHNI